MTLAPATNVENQAGHLLLDEHMRTAVLGDKQVMLSPSEYVLFEALAAKPGMFMSREALLQVLYTSRRRPRSNALTTLTKNVRAKLDMLGLPTAIVTRYSMGYAYDGPAVLVRQSVGER